MTRETPTAVGADDLTEAEPQQGVSVAQLDAAYASGPDPWRISHGFYERRKRDVLLGCLPRERYRSGFEPGCAEGELTARLAERCDRLLAVDYHLDAVSTTRQRVVGMPGRTVDRRLVPAQWPEAQCFDLVVVAELGYYLSAAAWATFCSRVAGSLDRGATVLACHWRHDFDGRTLATDELHHQLDRALPMSRCVRVVDDDFALDVWCGEVGTLAAREGRG
jgi:SAM-dependent methyltransferase